MSFEGDYSLSTAVLPPWYTLANNEINNLFVEAKWRKQHRNECDSRGIQTAPTTAGAALCVKMWWTRYLLKQTEKIHDVLRVEFVPVSIQGVCRKTESCI